MRANIEHQYEGNCKKNNVFNHDNVLIFLFLCYYIFAESESKICNCFFHHFYFLKTDFRHVDSETNSRINWAILICLATEKKTRNICRFVQKQHRFSLILTCLRSIILFTFWLNRFFSYFHSVMLMNHANDGNLKYFSVSLLSVDRESDEHMKCFFSHCDLMYKQTQFII